VGYHQWERSPRFFLSWDLITNAVESSQPSFRSSDGIQERAADPLAGGLVYGYQCGMLWGTAFDAGAQAYWLFGAGPHAEARAMIASQKIVASFRDINAVQSEKEIKVPHAPMSCSAMLAQRMGASDMHTVMAAGFAGGIGLSGGTSARRGAKACSQG
jgi:hypothetical protein